MMVKYRVRLFAGAAQVAGMAAVELAWIADDTSQPVSAIAGHLAAAQPQLVDWIARSRWAWRDEFVSVEALIPTGQELAMIPPVSGG